MQRQPQKPLQEEQVKAPLQTPQNRQTSHAPEGNSANGGYSPNTNSRTTDPAPHTDIYTPNSKTPSSGTSTATHTYTPGASNSGSTAHTNIYTPSSSSNGPEPTSSAGVTTYTPHAKSSGPAKTEPERGPENARGRVANSDGVITYTPHARTPEANTVGRNIPKNNLPVPKKPLPTVIPSRGGNGGSQSASAGAGATGSGNQSSKAAGQPLSTGSVSSRTPATVDCLPGDGPAGGCSEAVQGSTIRGNGASSTPETCFPGDGPAGDCSEAAQGSTTRGSAGTSGASQLSTNSDTNSSDPAPSAGTCTLGDETAACGGTSSSAQPPTSIYPPSEETSSTGTGAPAASDSTAANGSWVDPLPADKVSSDVAPATDERRAYSVSTEQEITNALNDGLSNSREASATSVATVADAGNWDQFSSSAASPSTYTSVSTFSEGSNANARAPDATDEQIDRDIQTVNADKDALGKILSSNDASDKITNQGIEVVGSVAHQMNHVINDLDSSGIFSTASSGNGFSAPVNSDIEGFVPAMTNTALEQALPGYKYANTINQELNTFQNYVSKKVQSVSCLFSFDPYCK